MKLKYVLAALVLFAAVVCVHGEPFTPDEGIFAFQEVDTFEINGLNFTLPTSYSPVSEDANTVMFKNGKDKIRISVSDDGKIKKVKSDKSKNITSQKTMMGSKNGYLVDKNGTYTFSYKDEGKLVTMKSKDMALMTGIIEFGGKQNG